jgi:hypothetical protein
MNLLVIIETTANICHYLSCFSLDCCFHACNVVYIFKIRDSEFMHGEVAWFSDI